jgi:hypothetical protein
MTGELAGAPAEAGVEPGTEAGPEPVAVLVPAPGPPDDEQPASVIATPQSNAGRRTREGVRLLGVRRCIDDRTLGVGQWPAMTWVILWL